MKRGESEQPVAKKIMESDYELLLVMGDIASFDIWSKII